MVKQNPFSYQTSTKKHLLLITDLNGQIVNIYGNASLINSSHSQLLLKNFFQDLITQNTKQYLTSLSISKQLMPKQTNSINFQCQFNPHIKIKKSTLQSQSDKNIKEKFNVSCFRSFVKFSSKLVYDKNVKISEVQSLEQLNKLRNTKFIQEIILIYIEPISKKHPNKLQKSQQNLIEQQTMKKQQEIQLNNYEQIKNEKQYQTPIKQKKGSELSTGKSRKSQFQNPQIFEIKSKYDL